MKTIVLGSGVIGVTTAFQLARRGHEVVVIDRQGSPAMETSYANAGQLSTGYSAPWAAPGVPLKAIKWLMSKHSPLVIRPTRDPAQWTWLARMLGNCTQAAYAVNKERMLRIANYSRDSLRSLRAETGIAYDERSRGTLQLFRSQQQMDAASKDTAILDRCGVEYELLDNEGCARVEPALGLVRDKIVGGLRLPDDETGDCFRFTRALMKLARDAGVTFRYNTDILGLETAGDRIDGLRVCSREPEYNGRFREAARPQKLTADAYVMALGSFSRAMLKPLGLRIPVYPVKGYSITVPITNAAGAPESTIMDETYKVAVTRLGDRIRAAGTAELSGYNTTLRDSRRATIEHVVRDLFPTGGVMAKGDFWAGLRPMTPDGTPIIGATRFGNLFLNTGHGTLGWTMSCGSAQLISDIVSGKSPDISTDGLGIERYDGPAATAAAPRGWGTPSPQTY